MSVLGLSEAGPASRLRRLTEALSALTALTAESAVPPAGAIDEARAVIERAIVDATDMPAPAVDPAAERSFPDPYDGIFGPDPTLVDDWAEANQFLARPRLERTRRRSRPHGLAWLPDVVQANDDEFELFVGSPWPARRVAEQGFPSSRLFLVGHLAQHATKAAHAVRVRIASQGAIDLLASDIAPPPELGADFDAIDDYVLPVGWLDRCHIVPDEDEGITARHPVSISCSGAGHGVDGIPEDIRWYPRRLRRSVTAYAVLTDADTTASGLRLYHRKPAPGSGRLVELRVGSGSAIDVAGSATRFKNHASVRTILDELHTDGVDLYLPPKAYARTVVTGEFVTDDHRWMPVGRGGTLASLLANTFEDR